MALHRPRHPGLQTETKRRRKNASGRTPPGSIFLDRSSKMSLHSNEMPNSSSSNRSNSIAESLRRTEPTDVSALAGLLITVRRPPESDPYRMRFVVNFVSHHVYCVDINIFSVIAYCSRSMVSIARSRDRCHPSNEIVFAFSSIDTVPTFRFSHPSEKLGCVEQ